MTYLIGLPQASMPLAWVSTWHIVVLLAIVLLLFGGRKLPEMARGLARGLRIFRDEMHGIKTDLDDTKSLPPPTQQQPPSKNESKSAEPSQEKKDEA